jgi:hypothetical protein
MRSGRSGDDGTAAVATEKQRLGGYLVQEVARNPQGLDHTLDRHAESECACLWQPLPQLLQRLTMYAVGETDEQQRPGWGCKIPERR